MEGFVICSSGTVCVKYSNIIAICISNNKKVGQAW